MRDLRDSSKHIDATPAAVYDSLVGSQSAATRGVRDTEPDLERVLIVASTMRIVSRLPRSFSLKTLLFVVTIVAILVYQFRADRAAKLRAEITAELTAAGCTALLGCQAPPGTAPEHATQEVVYVTWEVRSITSETFSRQVTGPLTAA
jgi:hypothetical protein